MDRRNFLRAAGLGVAAASLPGWMQACSSRTDPVTGVPVVTGAPSSIREALERARATGRPLLVFVVPADEERRRERGLMLGVYLNRAEPEPMADLALCDIWCARPQEIRDQLGCGTAVDDATIAALVETDGSGCKLVTGEPPPAGMHSFGRLEDDEAQVAEFEKRNQFLHERLHAVIAPDLETLRSRSAQACAKAFPKSDVVYDRLEVPDAKLARVVPAWVRLRAETADPASRAAWTKLLADEAARRWRAAPPPRAKWARSSGCGVDIEGETEQVMYACGMAHTPEYSSRFLVFFTEGRG